MLIRFYCALTVAVLLTTSASATFPEGPLEDGVFNYSDPLYMGDYFSFGTKLKFNEGQFPNDFEDSTGLTGFSVSSDAIAPVPGFQSGDDVPVSGQNLADLFPTLSPDGLVDVWADNSISAVGDFQNGFSEFSVHQRKVAEVAQTQVGQIGAASESKANVPFEVFSADTNLVPAKLDIHLDSIFSAEVGGGLSEGMEVQIINVSDPENPELVYDVGGFYFFFDELFEAAFAMGDTDLTDGFTIESPNETITEPVDASFSFEMDIMLDPSMTYAVNSQGDVSTFVENSGRAGIDSSNTLDVTIRLLDPNARLIIPGTSLVPEPATACLLLIGYLSLVVQQRRRI